MKLSPNFSGHEFFCPCCQKQDMHPGTVHRLQRLRIFYGHPISIVKGGGYRCQDYASDRPGSAHTLGMAVDPAIPQGDLFKVLRLALDVGFTGIGIKNKGGRWQLHLDDAPGGSNRVRPWIWTY